MRIPFKIDAVWPLHGKTLMESGVVVRRLVKEYCAQNCDERIVTADVIDFVIASGRWNIRSHANSTDSRKGADSDSIRHYLKRQFRSTIKSYGTIVDSPETAFVWIRPFDANLNSPGYYRRWPICDESEVRFYVRGAASFEVAWRQKVEIGNARLVEMGLAPEALIKQFHDKTITTQP